MNFFRAMLFELEKKVLAQSAWSSVINVY